MQCTDDVERTLTEPTHWAERLRLVPPQDIMDLMHMVDGMVDRMEQLGKITAEATGGGRHVGGRATRSRRPWCDDGAVWCRFYLEVPSGVSRFTPPPQ